MGVLVPPGPDRSSSCLEPACRWRSAGELEEKQKSEKKKNGDAALLQNPAKTTRLNANKKHKNNEIHPRSNSHIWSVLISHALINMTVLIRHDWAPPISKNWF